MPSPTTRVVVRVCTPYRVTAPSSDPALDLDAPGAPRLLQEHLKARDEATAAALPVLSGQKVTRFYIERLSRKALTWVLSTDDLAVRMQRAVACGCHRYVGPDGERTATTQKSASGWVESDETWLDDLHRDFGQIGLDEIGAAIVDLSSAGASQLAPFGLPPGLKLSR